MAQSTIKYVKKRSTNTSDLDNGKNETITEEEEGNEEEKDEEEDEGNKTVATTQKPEVKKKRKTRKDQGHTNNVHMNVQIHNNWKTKLNIDFVE